MHAAIDWLNVVYAEDCSDGVQASNCGSDCSSSLRLRLAKLFDGRLGGGFAASGGEQLWRQVVPGTTYGDQEASLPGTCHPEPSDCLVL